MIYLCRLETISRIPSCCGTWVDSGTHEQGPTDVEEERTKRSERPRSKPRKRNEKILQIDFGSTVIYCPQSN